MIPIVPSPELETAEAALDRLLVDKTSVRAAVAFVTASGVDLLAALLDRHPQVLELEIVARGAPVTDPQALRMARDRLGARVNVVVGAEANGFHPKLWLLQGGTGLEVLAGSGNLTAGGLRDNREQFELSQVDDPAEIEAHEQRFEALTAGAVSLEELEGSIAWREWLRLQRDRERLRRELDRVDRKIVESPVGDGRSADKLALLADLDRIYEETVARKIPRRDGQRYVPTRFKQGIERARESNNPVRLVFNMCRQQTKGFDVILTADEPLLTVESLVVDSRKPYHDLFEAETRRLSAERLRQFSSWNQGNT